MNQLVLVPNGPSKSQRKKQRLLQRLRGIASGSTTSNSQSSSVTLQAIPQTRSRKSQSRNARRKRRRQGFGNFQNDVSDYLRTMMDPENNPGIKVPDMVTFPSSTFQLTADLLVSQTGVGDGVGLWFAPFIGTGSVTFPIYTGVNAAAGGAYTWTGANWASRSTVASVYTSFRPVSAVIYAEFTGNSTADSGQICMGILPRSANGPGATLNGFANALTQNYTKTLPLRNGGYVLWKPQDNLDLEYFKDITSTNDAELEFIPQVFFATSGMAVGASVRFRVVANFEAIPAVDTFNIVGRSPSPVNLSALSQAMNWAGQVYNNMGAFVNTVSPFVQPTLRSAFDSASPFLGRALGSAVGLAVGGGALGLRGQNSLRLGF